MILGPSAAAFSFDNFTGVPDIFWQGEASAIKMFPAVAFSYYEQSGSVSE